LGPLGAGLGGGGGEGGGGLGGRDGRGPVGAWGGGGKAQANPFGLVAVSFGGTESAKQCTAYTANGPMSVQA